MLNTSFFLLTAWLSPIHYEENDDVVMCMIANGVFSGSPDGHLVFINALYGWVIAGMYLMTRAVEWYTLAFCVLHILAMTTITCSVMKENVRLSWKALFLVLMYVLWVRMIVAFQFTTTAGLLCLSGCLALQRHGKKWKTVGMGEIFVASLIRFQAAALVGLVFAPLFVFIVFSVKGVERKRFAIWMGAVVLLPIAGKCADGFFYRDSDWANYMAYNAVRGEINDNPNVWFLTEEDMPEGVDWEDFFMLRSFAGDPEIMTLEKVQAIKMNMDRKSSVQQKKIIVESQLRPYNWLLLMLCFGLLFVFVSSYRNINGRQVALLASFLLSILVLAYLCSIFTLKKRVVLCVLMPLLYLLTTSVSQKEGNGIERFGKCCLAGVMIVLSLNLLYENYKIVKSVQKKQQDWSTLQLPLVISEDVKTLYPTAFQMECYSPLEIKDIDFRVAALGWVTGIPFQKGILDNYRAFVDSSIIILGRVDNPPLGFVELIKKNYNMETRVETIKQNQRYALFKIVSK